MDRWQRTAIQISGLRKMQTDDWIAAGTVVQLLPLVGGYRPKAAVRSDSSSY